MQGGPKVMLLKKIEYFPYGSSKEADFFFIDRGILEHYTHKNKVKNNLC